MSADRAIPPMPNFDAGKQYRLYPSDINELGYVLAAEYIPDLKPSPKSYHIIERYNKRMVLAPVCKDAESDANEGNLPFIRDFIVHFRDTNEGDFVLIIPLLLCRGFLKAPPVGMFHRMHIVFALIRLENGKFYCDVHDSQTALRDFIYPDKLITFAGDDFVYDHAKNYFTHGIQEDDVSCGYHLNEWRKQFVKNGYCDFKHVLGTASKLCFDRGAYLAQHGIIIDIFTPLDKGFGEHQLEAFEVVDDNGEETVLLAEKSPQAIESSAAASVWNLTTRATVATLSFISGWGRVSTAGAEVTVEDEKDERQSIESGWSSPRSQNG